MVGLMMRLTVAWLVRWERNGSLTNSGGQGRQLGYAMLLAAWGEAPNQQRSVLHRANDPGRVVSPSIDAGTMNGPAHLWTEARAKEFPFLPGWRLSWTWHRQAMALSYQSDLISPSTANFWWIRRFGGVISDGPTAVKASN
jgi:hypothetical protein